MGGGASRCPSRGCCSGRRRRRRHLPKVTAGRQLQVAPRPLGLVGCFALYPAPPSRSCWPNFHGNRRGLAAGRRLPQASWSRKRPAARQVGGGGDTGGGGRWLLRDWSHVGASWSRFQVGPAAGPGAPRLRKRGKMRSLRWAGLRESSRRAKEGRTEGCPPPPNACLQPRRPPGFDLPPPAAQHSTAQQSRPGPAAPVCAMLQLVGALRLAPGERPPRPAAARALVCRRPAVPLPCCLWGRPAGRPTGSSSWCLAPASKQKRGW